MGFDTTNVKKIFESIICDGVGPTGNSKKAFKNSSDLIK